MVVEEAQGRVTLADIHGTVQPVAIRPALPEDARTFLAIHRVSIRGIAAQHYPPEVIEKWASPENPGEEFANGFLANRDGEIRLIAELDGAAVGIGALVTAKSELRACYVSPSALRKGVGTALVREIERLAVEHGLNDLHLVASINSEPFYAALGYEVVEHGEHVLRSGQRMACVRMRRRL
jgi:putative acetyltransferase